MEISYQQWIIWGSTSLVVLLSIPIAKRFMWRIYSGNHCVEILNPDMTFSSSFGSEDSGDGQFSMPYDVAFDNTGNVYVADYYNHHIQVFTAEGQFLRKF